MGMTYVPSSWRSTRRSVAFSQTNRSLGVQPTLAESTSGGPARAMARSQIVPMVAALMASVIAFQLNATRLIPAIRTINESSAGRVCGDVDLLLPRRCRLQRRAHPVERLRRPQTRHDRHVR